jgi:Glycosyltransferase family 87
MTSDAPITVPSREPDRPPSRLQRLDHAAMIAWLVGSIFMAAMAFLEYGQDFRGYYAAARVVMAGGNPYDYNVLAPVLNSITLAVGNYPYYYAPWLAWIMMPLAQLPFELARGVWMFFNLAVWNVSLWQLGKWIEWPREGWRRWSLFLVATVVFAWITWRDEQTGILLFGLLMLAAAAIRKRNWALGGLCLALLLVKPNISLIPVFAISLWLARRRAWGIVGSMCGWTLAMLGTAWLSIPNWHGARTSPGFGQGLFDAISGPGQSLGPRLHSTLLDWLTVSGVPAGAATTLSAVAFLIGAVIVVRAAWTSDSLIKVVAGSLLVNFAITPYAFQYDYPPLAVVFFWALALGTAAPRHWTAWIAPVLALFVTSVPFWERPISDGYWMVIGLIALTLWGSLSAGLRQGRAGLPLN